VKISLHLFSAESATSGIENPSSHFSWITHHVGKGT